MNAYDIIFFDVDSTIVAVEGVDWLAERKGVYEEVARLTKLSMEGEVTIDAVFAQKLNLLAPSIKELESVGEMYCQSLTDDASQFIESLQSAGKEVWLVSGSFHPAIAILADYLKIPIARTKTNAVYFHD